MCAPGLPFCMVVKEAIMSLYWQRSGIGIIVAASFLFLFSSSSTAGPGCCPPPSSGGGASTKPKVYGRGGEKPSKPRPPEPYNGQLHCPVCQGPLAAQGEPISVEGTLTTSAKKTFWQKIGLVAASPEKLSYFVCGAACAGAAQEQPNRYLISVIAGGSHGR